MIKNIFIAILILSQSIMSHEVEKHYWIKDYTLAELIEVYNVFDITQSSSGYLYFLTKDYFIRFDGKEFDIINHLVDNEKKFSALCIDNSDYIYLGCDSNLYVIRDSLSRYDRVKKISLGSKIECLYDSKEDGVWIGCHKRLYRYADNVLRGPFVMDELTCSIKDIEIVEKNKLLLGMANRLYSFEYFPDNNYELKTLSRKGVNRIYKDKEGLIWLGMDKGLYVYQKSVLKKIENELGLCAIYDLDFDINGEGWVATSKGLYHLKGERVVKMEFSGGSPDEYINSLFLDREGNIWLGKRNYISKVSKKITEEFEMCFQGRDLVIKDIDRLNNGELIITSLNRGLFIFDEDHLTPFLLKEDYGILKKERLKLLTTFCENDDKIWLGTTEGLFFFESRDGKISGKSVIDGKRVMDMIKGKDESLWIGTWNGIYKYQDGNLIYFNTEDGLIDDQVRTIFEDDDGMLWLGTRKGLSVFNGNEFVNFGAESGLRDSNIWSIMQDGDKDMYVALNSGIYKYTPMGFEWMKYPWKMNRRSMVSINRRGGRIYIGTKHNYYEFNDGYFKRVLPGGELYSIKKRFISSLITQNEKLWLGGNGILLKIDLRAEDLVSRPVHLFVKDVKINGSERKDLMNLSHTDNNMEFHLSMINLTHPERVVFQYKVLNYQDSWVKTSNPKINLYKIPPGRYKFEAMAFNKAGMQSKNRVVIPFKISPPFWKTPFFYFFILFQFIILLTAFIFFINNISLRKSNLVIAHTKDELERSEKRYRAIVQDQTELIFRYYRDGTMIFVNDAFCRFFQISYKEIVNRKFHPRMPSKEYQKFQKKLMGLSPENKIASGDFPFYKENEVRWLQVTSRLIYEQRDKIEIQSVALDITKRVENERKIKKYIKELNDLNHELSQYIYMASHDLKAPLYAIHNYVDFLKEDLDGQLEEEQEEYMNNMMESVLEAERMVKDVLEYSKLDKKKTQPVKIKSRKMIEETLSAIEWGSDSEILIEGEWPTIYVDTSLVKQALLNLVQNGLKFNRSKKKKIIIKGETRKKRFLIHVEDNGIGIKRRYYKQIFGMFERLHSEQEFTGTGIGLAIVKKACSNLNGSVIVNSSEKGSIFTINIPIKPRIRNDIEEGSLS